jgi:type I restriction enzyme, S subunit
LARGGNQENLNLNIVGNMNIITPPIDLQNQFAPIVEKTESLKIHYQQSLQELENLYGSLSQQAFMGELGLLDEKLMMVAEPEVLWEMILI